MTAATPPLRWWGWGDRTVTIPHALLRLLHEEIDAPLEPVTHAPAMEAVRVPDAALPERARRRLAAAVGTHNLRRDPETRIRHAAGRSYVDLLRLRSGALQDAPDAVVYPSTQAEIVRLLRACSDTGCAVVPFGGGTSVVGGVRPVRHGFGSVITLALDNLDGIVHIDGHSHLATFEAGLSGPSVEAALQRNGLTLDHFPQSFEYATVGGFAATRSAGQASSGFGRFDEMVRGATLVAPAGVLELQALPPDATGPSMLQLVLGSEGTLGVIGDVTVRVQALPRLRHYAACSFADFRSGTEAVRTLAQHRALPDVTRLSDSEETRASLALSRNQAGAAAMRRYLRLRGHRDACLAIFGWEGDGAAVGARVRRAAHVLRRHGAVALGTAPGRAWLRSRFEAPYLRDSLLDHGLVVETLETAATWTALHEVRDAVLLALRTALSSGGAAPLVGCHVSHVYPEGASLYFTVLGRQNGDPVAQWQEAKRAATDALLAARGVLSHHHGVGRDHAPWLGQQLGNTGIAILQSIRSHLDPAGVMNPGVLLTQR